MCHWWVLLTKVWASSKAPKYKVCGVPRPCGGRCMQSMNGARVRSPRSTRWPCPRCPSYWAPFFPRFQTVPAMHGSAPPNSDPQWLYHRWLVKCLAWFKELNGVDCSRESVHLRARWRRRWRHPDRQGRGGCFRRGGTDHSSLSVRRACPTHARYQPNISVIYQRPPDMTISGFYQADTRMRQ